MDSGCVMRLSEKLCYIVDLCTLHQVEQLNVVWISSNLIN